MESGLVRVSVADDAGGTALPGWKSGSDAGRSAGAGPEEAAGRFDGDSGHDFQGGGGLSRRVGAGGGRGDYAAGPTPAAEQHAGEGVDLPCAAAAGATGFNGRRVYEEGAGTNPGGITGIARGSGGGAGQ